MARGDWTTFEELADQLGPENHNFAATDVFKLGIVSSGASPAAGDITPTWSDYSGSEVGTGGGYPSGGISLTYGSVTRWAEAAGVATFDADDITISQNGSGFTNGYYGILYNDTQASKMAIGFLDLGGPVSEQAGDININWHASGILTFTISA